MAVLPVFYAMFNCHYFAPKVGLSAFYVDGRLPHFFTGSRLPLFPAASFSRILRPFVVSARLLRLLTIDLRLFPGSPERTVYAGGGLQNQILALKVKEC